MTRWTAPPFLLAIALGLLGAVPSHVQTADYWEGYAGTKVVPASQAAQWLSWVETDGTGSEQIAPLGVRTMLYTNPNRLEPGDSMYSDRDENEFAHTCSGKRALTTEHYAGQTLSNPRSPTLARNWKYAIQQRDPTGAGQFSAIFVDDADGSIYAMDQPCGYDLDDWLQGEIGLFRSLGLPIVYNGLSDFYQHGVAKEIALNAAAIGGMLEECYAQLEPDHRVGGWRWLATEETESQMAAAHKYFFCYGRDTAPADQEIPSRLYTYASFLLTYDPDTSVLWEYYKSPSGAHVMPESELVAWSPVRRVNDIRRFRTENGVYVRAYRACYIAGRPVGPCAAAVNPDDEAHPLRLFGYRRTLALSGAGVFDGGTVQIVNQPPPADLAPLQAVIAFR
jgi:hypothetical protein